MKRILSLLLTAALTAVLLVSPAAAADPAPWVEANGVGTSHLTVSIRGLSGSYDSVQITLTLDRLTDGAFEFSQPLRDDGAACTTYSVSGNSVTLYATSRNQINQGEAILLGTLTGPEGFQALSASNLKLLDLETDGGGESAYPNVSIGEPGSSGGTGGTGGAGGTGSTGGTGGTSGGSGTGSTGGTASTGGTGSAGTAPFTDVKRTDWFYDAVAYVNGAKLMTGTSPTAFSPQNATTRAMIVTILYRYEGSPAAGASTFQDVPAGQYYTDAVAWAAANGVVTGYNNARFGPNDYITREQMAAILYRYAQYKGFDVSGRADLSGYADASQISLYARDSMAWANRSGLITGVDPRTLQPGGYAVRAQVASILMRFCENIAK